MDGKNDKEINDVVSKLRASVDKPAPKTRKSGVTDMGRFDREIAALIEKQLSGREPSPEDKQGKNGSLISDEIRLEDFVADGDADESVGVSVAQEPTDITPEVPQTEQAAEIAEAGADYEQPADSQIDRPDDKTDDVQQASEEMPPAVADALAEAFAVDGLDFSADDGTASDNMPDPGEPPFIADEPEAESEQESLISPEQEFEDEAEPEPDELSVSADEPEAESEQESLISPEQEFEDEAEPEPGELSVSADEPKAESEPESLISPEQEFEDEAEPEPDELPVSADEPEPESAPDDELSSTANDPEPEELPSEETPTGPSDEELHAMFDLGYDPLCDSDEASGHTSEAASEKSSDDTFSDGVDDSTDTGRITDKAGNDPDEVSDTAPGNQPDNHDGTEHNDMSDTAADGWGYVGAEYSSHGQDAKIKSDYRRARTLTSVRLIFVSLICGLCAYMENLGIFGFKLLRPFEPTEDPAIFMLTLTVLTLTAALLCFKDIRDGFVSMIKFDPEPHAITSLAFAVGVIYDIVMLIVRPDGIRAYNFPVTLCMVMSVAAELFALCREQATFDVVSAETVRYSPVRESGAFEQKYNSRPVAKDGERVKRRVYNMASADFTDGYFRRTHEKKRGVYILNFMLLPALAVGLVECIISASMGGGIVGAMSSLMAAVLMTLPAPLLICLTLPSLAATLALKKDGCAVVGDSSVDEYSRPKLLVFEDRAMFPAELIGTKGLKLYEGFELYDVLIKTGSLFAAIGGPLGEIFQTESAKYHRIHDVELVRVQRGGVEARLEGKTTILAGNLDFLAHYGIYPPSSPRDKQLIAEGVVSVIFIVLNGRPAARLYADYRTSEQFERQLTQLGSHRDAAAIRTSDPGIDEIMISRKRTLPDYELSVIRPGFARSDAPQETVDSGVVALDDPVKIIGAMNECHKLKNKRRRGLLTYFCVFLVNVIVATLIVSLQLIDFASSGAVGLYMLAWTLPAFLMAGGHKNK